MIAIDHASVLLSQQLVDHKLKRSLELAGEKGAGAWLSALPLQSLGYDLNKQEFRDGICLRYSWYFQI